MKKFIYVIVCVFSCIIVSSCQNETMVEEKAETKQIVASKISLNNSTRSEFLDDNYSVGFHCSSASSPLVADIFYNESNDDTKVLILNNQDEVAYVLNFKVVRSEGDNILFTAYNEFDEPLMSGTYNTTTNYIEIPTYYGNDVFTRASAASWGCNMGLALAGAAWSFPLGMISGGAALVVGLAYTAAAVKVCDGL